MSTYEQTTHVATVDGVEIRTATDPTDSLYQIFKNRELVGWSKNLGAAWGIAQDAGGRY